MRVRSRAFRAGVDISRRTLKSCVLSWRGSPPWRAQAGRATRSATMNRAARSRVTTGGAGGNAHGADPRVTNAAAALLRDLERHREPDRDGAPGHAQRQALAGRSDDSALGRAGPRANGDALPPDQRPSRARRAGDGPAEEGAVGGRGVSPRTRSSQPATKASTKDGSGAILRRGGAISVFPQKAAASTHTTDVSEPSEL